MNEPFRKCRFPSDRLPERERRSKIDTKDKPFSSIFSWSSSYDSACWRTRNSGVHSRPYNSQEMHAVFSACHLLGISVEEKFSGSAAHADSYEVSAKFLDGGIEGMTGNYLFSPRGVWIFGCKATLLIALQLGLKVRKGWYKEHGLVGATLASLKVELANTSPPSR